MKLSLLEIEFHLPGCRSLKEKRGRLRGLRDRYGKLGNVALCESDFQNVHDRSLWSFVIVGTESKIIDQTIARLQESIEEVVDALVASSRREDL